MNIQRNVICAFAMMLLMSCSYDDTELKSRIDELELRVDKLEELCKDNNTNIASLQVIVEALQNEDHVISIVDIVRAGEKIGCVITFEKSGSVTIYYSNNEGGTPIVGVAQDVDGVYYWTMNGDWMLDDNGKKVQAEGVTPTLKVNDGYWWVSYDNGTTWNNIGESGGVGGSGIFREVTYDENYAYFTLADGTILVFPLSSVVQPAAEGTITEGCLNGAFSVSATKQVKFSQGNLQYQASTNTWRFALQQYDYVGNALGNTTTENRNSQSDWIDLFGFGTSGWDGGVVAYQPWSISLLQSDYYVGGESSIGLTGNYANADWGVYNSISNGGNATNAWRTLTFAEWTYLFDSRADKYALATIESITGMVLIPDAFILPDGVAYTSGIGDGYTTNIYTLAEWIKMQDAGAVFLPSAGYRNGESMKSVGEQGRYWSSDVHDDNSCNCVYILASGKNLTYCNRSYGMSVRLIQDVK